MRKAIWPPTPIRLMQLTRRWRAAGLSTSVPRAPVTFLLTVDGVHSALALHDWAYPGHPVPRDVTDAALPEASLVSGVPAGALL